MTNTSSQTALLPSAHSLISLSDHLRQTRPEISPSVPYPGCPHPSDLAFLESGALPPATLSKTDVEALKELYHGLTRIAQRSERRGVKIVVDAEYSWYQVCYQSSHAGPITLINFVTH